MEEDRQTTRSPVRGEDGNMQLDTTSHKQDAQRDTMPDEASTRMSRSSSEASTSSALSSDDEKLLNKTVAPKERVSIYVQVFEEMLNTVLEYESHLFDEAELEMLARFKTMSCECHLRSHTHMSRPRLSIWQNSSTSVLHRSSKISLRSVVFSQKRMVPCITHRIS